jgi:hypothetical protein
LNLGVPTLPEAGDRDRYLWQTEGKLLGCPLLMPQPQPPRRLEDQFVENVARYPTYFVTVLLGGIWAGLQPFVNLYRKSATAAALVTVGSLALLLFIYFTLRAMTGHTLLPAWMWR